MKVTINLNNKLYNDLKAYSEVNGTTITDEIEKAILLMLKKRALIRKLMNDTCDEYDEAMRQLAS
ncbi:MAG: hypothetical protein JSW07_17555 [bacterium]|nr:MAG: hypothetical protein JSW07_17555 [bacterium]